MHQSEIMEINNDKKKKKKKKKKKHIPSNISQRSSNTEQYAFNYDKETESDTVSLEGPRSEAPGYNY